MPSRCLLVLPIALALNSACVGEVGMTPYAPTSEATPSDSAATGGGVAIVAARANCDRLADNFLFEVFVDDPGATIEWMTITVTNAVWDRQEDQFPLYYPVDEHTWELAVFDEQTPTSCGPSLDARWDVHLANGDELVLVRPIGDAL